MRRHFSVFACYSAVRTVPVDCALNLHSKRAYAQGMLISRFAPNSSNGPQLYSASQLLELRRLPVGDTTDYQSALRGCEMKPSLSFCIARFSQPLRAGAKYLL